MKALLYLQSSRYSNWINCYDAEGAEPRFLFQMFDEQAARVALKHRGYTKITMSTTKPGAPQ